MVHVPPPPQVAGPGGVIRFAVGDPTGPRSQAWNVVGNKTTDDVYLGVRVRMHEVKLSLHPEKWRMALTAQAAARLLPPDVDRVLHRWTPPAELASGWRQGATVAVPSSSLQAGWPEPRPRQGAIAFFPAPLTGWGLRFDVLLGAVQRDDLTVNGIAGEVGRLTRPSGAVAWIVATEVPVHPAYEDGLQELRRKHFTDWAWGDGEDGAPVLIDLGVTKG